MRFVHVLAEPCDATAIGPGWPHYRDRLTAVVGGRPVPEDWDEHHPGLAEAYALPSA